MKSQLISISKCRSFYIYKDHRKNFQESKCLYQKIEIRLMKKMISEWYYTIYIYIGTKWNLLNWRVIVLGKCHYLSDENLTLTQCYSQIEVQIPIFIPHLKSSSQNKFSTISKINTSVPLTVVSERFIFSSEWRSLIHKLLWGITNKQI